LALKLRAIFPTGATRPQRVAMGVCLREKKDKPSAEMLSSSAVALNGNCVRRSCDLQHDAPGLSQE